MANPNPGPGKPFPKGESGNKGGRPPGTKNKIQEVFLKAICADFEVHGEAVIAQVRQDDPSTYLRVIAALMPKEAKLDVEHSGSVEHRGLPEISQRVTDLLAGRADRDSSALLPH